MAVFKSEEVTVPRTPGELAEKFADFTVLRDKLDTLPEDKRRQLGEVELTADTISFNSQFGKITLKAIERTPNRLVLEGQSMAAPMKLIVEFDPEGETSSRLQGSIEIEVPMMVMPMVKPMLSKAASQFGKLFQSLA